MSFCVEYLKNILLVVIYRIFLIFKGANGDVLIYDPPSPHYPGYPKDISIRFWPGLWKKQSPRGGNVMATREDIMSVLVDIESILVR